MDRPKRVLLCNFSKSFLFSVIHRAAAYYQLFFCNKIVLSCKTLSKCEFFSKKVKNTKFNQQKTVKLITFLLLKTSPKSIVLLTYAYQYQGGGALFSPHQSKSASIFLWKGKLFPIVDEFLS